MHIAEGYKAAHKEAGTDEQGERDGNFEDDDGVAETAMSCAAAGAFAAVAERIIEVASDDLERGREAEDDGGEYGDAESEEKDRDVEADDGFGGNDLLGDDGDKGL
jgi:hypothetical protein